MVGSEELKREEAKAVSASAPVGTVPFNAFAGNGIIGRFGPAGQLSGSMPTAMALDGQKPLGVGGSTANVPVVQNAPTFQKDDTKKDGGFFGWLGGLIKKRPGIRSGESADEYDERMTRNKMRIATLADAIRHMGNIYNTSKGAPLQRFNNPVEGLQNGLQQKAGERAEQNAKDMNEYRKGMLGIQEGNLKLSGERLGETKRHNRAQEGISASRMASARAKSGSGRGGKTSGGKYWFEDKNGKMHYQSNKTMWEQEYYREYGALPNGESNTSVSTKAYNSKGEEVTTTQRKKGPSMTSQAAQQQNKARALRKNNAKPKKGGWASGFKL